MSESGQQRAAHIRKSYTEESFEAAFPGINRRSKATHVPPDLEGVAPSEFLVGDSQGYDLGLDSCDDAQLNFRAIMALGLFNYGSHYGSIAAPPAQWNLGVLTWYTIKVSPRWNRLVLITSAPDNVMQRIVPDSFHASRTPGMRLLRSHGRTYVARHIPTGAEIVVTSREDGKSDGVHNPMASRFLLMSDVPVSRREEEQLSSLPGMARNARRLLAGLVTRMSMTDPRRKWSTGNWYWDPLERPESENRESGDTERRLWGEGYEWDIEWHGYPHPSDVAQSMTDPVVGLQGSRLGRNRNSYEVILGSSVLRVKK
ncbi:hypothetical protein GCM10010211_37480 [Streptomyces albospinus]|uniref:Uncharacterized protein n=1 Tax=Streptomyces albospinus TaxID=285515 RepID=A0ABQ2V587_9ACTN|nr:hypothetical protein [Streptomyces albospinus]GGU68623.1 hypothetical protein GCM10010211_37480 [Streptomyces albospinus]